MARPLVFSQVQMARPKGPTKVRLLTYQPFLDIIAEAQSEWIRTRYFRFDTIVSNAGHWPIWSTFVSDDWRWDVEQALWARTGTRSALVTEALFNTNSSYPVWPAKSILGGAPYINAQGVIPSWFDAMQDPDFAKWFVASMYAGEGVGLCHADAFGGALDQVKAEQRIDNGIGAIQAGQGRQNDLQQLGLIPNAGEFYLEKRP